MKEMECELDVIEEEIKAAQKRLKKVVEDKKAKQRSNTDVGDFHSMPGQAQRSKDNVGYCVRSVSFIMSLPVYKWVKTFSGGRKENALEYLGHLEEENSKECY